MDFSKFMRYFFKKISERAKLLTQGNSLLYKMDTSIFNDLSSPTWIISMIVGTLLLILFDISFFRYNKRRFVWGALISLELGMIACAFFVNTWFLMLVLVLVFLIFAFCSSLINSGDYRSAFSNSFKSPFSFFFLRRRISKTPEVLFDQEEAYSKIEKAVFDMSKAKRGALITFIRKDNILDDSKMGTVIKQPGVEVNAPISSELLETIFYVGTRLHDGAVVIKDNTIVRASVFFQPTSKGLTGKYGSRHQAALGISENSDSVTIVVSEETGRISIAYNGELNPVRFDNFMNVFLSFMEIDESPNE